MDPRLNNSFFIDSHCHLPLLKERTQAVIEKCSSLSILKILNVGFDIDSSMQSIQLARTFPSIDSSIGIHPHYANGNLLESMAWMEKEIRQKNIVAIGEIGLDTIRSKTNQSDQIEWFEAQLDIAQKNSLPVIIHNREADDKIESVLDQYKNCKGILHCFSSGIEFAIKMISKGWFLSFSGNCTYPKNEIMRSVIKQIPLDHLFLETDAPYLTPLPYRGMQENSPVFMPDIYDFVARLRKESKSSIMDQVVINYFSLFKNSRME